MENNPASQIPGAYFQRFPRRGYRKGTSLDSAHSACDGLAVLRQAFPGLQRQEHEDRARRHALASLAASRKYNAELNTAALETWGRPFQFGDYKVSGICSEDFSEARKKTLREFSTIESQHHRLAILHAMAAGRTHRTALRWFEQLLAEQRASLQPRKPVGPMEAQQSPIEEMQPC